MFAGYTLNQEENDEFKYEKYKKTFNELISKSGDQVDRNVIEYINAISEVNGQKQRLLFAILENAVQQNVLTTMTVCQALLTADKLQFTNEEFWCSSFDLIMNIVDKADYKEIRDILKIMLDIISNIPASFNIALIPQLNAIYRIFEHVFDPNLALFPAYLVFDEIRKKTQTKSGTPHWKFSQLISSFVNSFKPVANMCSQTGRTRLFPVICYRTNSNKVWQLDPQCKFIFKGLLPLNEELLKPQLHFLKYALMQPYSKEFVITLLQLKARSTIIEDLFNEMLVSIMEKTEETDLNQMINQWQLLANNIRDFSTTITFHEMIKRLIPLIAEKNLKKGRDQLIWLVLQLLTMYLVKTPFTYFVPFIKLIDILYTEKEPLPLPNLSNPLCVQSFAATSIWKLLMMKAETEQSKLTRSPPIALKNHIEFIQQNATNISYHNLNSEFKLSVIANAYFANNNSNNANTASNEPLPKIMSCLIEYVTGNMAQNIPARPLSNAFLDSLCVQMKIHLTQNLINLINKQVVTNKKSIQPISPTALESFFRLVANNETENPFIKMYIANNLYPSMASQFHVVVHNLLETWVYRTNHTKITYRIQITSLLHTAANNQQIQNQLKLCMENTLLKLILKMNIGEVIMLLTQMSLIDSLVSKESEEYNKIFILLIARTIHITHYSETLSSDWFNDLLSNVMQNTPLSWSLCTIKCFPKHINEHYQKQNQRENRHQVISFVEDEFNKFLTIQNNESELIQHFSQPSTPTVFICVIWKSLLDSNQLNPVAFKVLDKLTSKQFTASIRSFCDYLVFELANTSGQQLSKYIDTLNDLIWKYHILTLDKLFLCLALRPFEGEIEFNICLLIIQHVLLKKNEFRNRMNDFVKDFTPDHWLNDQQQEKQTAFLAKYPEKFFFEFIPDKQVNLHPYYFSNVCLRFLPVLDLIIHRYLEQFRDNQTNTNTIMETILEQMSPLYKFHDQPITFLYNTLHYYEAKLRTKPFIKRRLVASVLNPFREIRSKDWALSEEYNNYINTNNNDWNPSLEYYIKLVGRLVDTIKGKQAYPNFDWKFNEFTNAGCHALHIICVELMALPKLSSQIANGLIDIIMIGHKTIPRTEIMNWINAVGLILTALPEDFKSALNNRIIQMLESPMLTTPDRSEDIFRVMDFTASHNSLSELQITYLIALTHSFYQHSFIGQLSLFPEFLSENVKPLIKTEEQFIFICHLVAPFLDRLVIERTRIACDVTTILYQMLSIVDKNVKEFYYMEPICDLLYYIKYSFTGDSVKDDIGPFIHELREPLKRRLRFVVHLPLNNLSVKQSAQSVQNNLNQMNPLNQNIATIKQEKIGNQITQSASLKHPFDTTNQFDTKRLKTN